jgi:hypothetical protein
VHETSTSKKKLFILLYCLKNVLRLHNRHSMISGGRNLSEKSYFNKMIINITVTRLACNLTSGHLHHVHPIH